MHPHVPPSTDGVAVHLDTPTPSAVASVSVTLSGVARRSLQHQILESRALTSRERRRLLECIRQAEANTAASILDDGILLDDLQRALLDHTLQAPCLRPDRRDLTVEHISSVAGCIVRLHASVLWWRRACIWALGSERTRESVADVIAAHKVEAQPSTLAFDAIEIDALRRMMTPLPFNVDELMP